MSKTIHTAMTPPRINESLRLRRFILCTRLLMTGNLSVGEMLVKERKKRVFGMERAAFTSDQMRLMQW